MHIMLSRWFVLYLFLQTKVQWRLEHEAQIRKNFYSRASHRLSKIFKDVSNAR